MSELIDIIEQLKSELKQKDSIPSTTAANSYSTADPLLLISIGAAIVLIIIMITAIGIILHKKYTCIPRDDIRLISTSTELEELNPNQKKLQKIYNPC